MPESPRTRFRKSDRPARQADAAGARAERMGEPIKVEAVLRRYLAPDVIKRSKKRKKGERKAAAAQRDRSLPFVKAAEAAEAAGHGWRGDERRCACGWPGGRTVPAEWAAHLRHVTTQP
jgi:hypothetical protein